jgi:N-acetylglucosaminyldiphosphoundecaprenol N-acetyl-beta-D-mannosaminyltransferase
MIKRFLKSGRRPYSIFAANPEKIFLVKKDRQFYEAFKNADLILPDGAGIVFAAKILCGIRLKRVTGIETMINICKLAEKEDHRIFIYGAREEINKAAVENLRKNYPRLKIAGRAGGYVNETKMSRLLHSINESRAKILFLALGSPKQEKWFASYKNYLENVKVCQCIGGTLDIIAGSVRRAPEIWQKYSAEWLYRLIIEPKRIRRQKVLPVFAVMVLFSRLKMFFNLRK